jgi:hypothetical protein
VLPRQAAVTPKRCNANLTANIEYITGGTSTSKKDIAKNHVTVQEAKRELQYDDIYGYETSSVTVDFF